MRLLKWTCLSIAGVVLLGVFAYGALVLVNLKDEALSAEAKAFAEAAKLDIPTERNGYFALYGWRAPEGADPHAAGIAAIGELTKDIREGKFEREERTGLLPRVDMDALCNLRKPDCLEKVRASRAAVEFQLAKHETLRLRIRDAARYPAIHAPDLPYHPLAPVPLPGFSEMWRLGATESAHAWISGRPAEALALSAERIAIARRMIRDSSNLLYTVLGSVWLRAEYLLLLEILQREPLAARAHMSAFEKLLRPLAPEELHSPRWVHGLFAGTLDEYRAFTAIPAQRRAMLGPILLGTDGDVFFATDLYKKNLPWWFAPAVWLATPLFQPNTTANAVLPLLSTLARTAREGAKGASALDWKRGTPAALDSGWGAYNLVGRIAGLLRAEDYLLRLHNCDRFLRLVAVHGALVKGRIPVKGVETFLAAHSGAIDPVTGKAMRWDAARSSLYVEALYPQGTTLEHQRIGDVGGQISVEYRP